jgi:hypothetical protein
LKAKIKLHLFQQYFTPHTPPLKQGESKTTLSPDLPSTHIIRSTIPFRKCFKSSSPMSDLVTRYSPQATTRFNMPSFSPIQTRNLKIRMSVNKEKELRKNDRNISVTRISNPANGAKITFETYN